MTWRGDVKAPYNFSWFIVNEVAACAYPKTVGEVKWLKEQGIKHILCLDQAYSISYTINPSIKQKEEIVIQQKTVNLEEFKGLTKDDMKELVNYFNNIKMLAEPIVIHCRMGYGRTGMVLAIYLMMFENADVTGAIQKVRSLRPRSIETKSQEESLHTFYDFYHNKETT